MDPRPFAVGTVQSHGLNIRSIENPPDHAGETGARSDLDEGPYSGPVHLLDLADEIHGAGKLPGKQLAHGISGLGIGGPGSVGEQLFAGGLKSDLLQPLGKRCSGIRNQGTVEGRGNRQPLTVQTGFPQQPFRFLDDLRRAGEHALFRRVTIGQNQLEAGRVQEFVDPLQGGADRQHGSAITAAAGHQFSAQAGKAHQIVGGQDFCGTECGQLAETVAGDRLGCDSETRQNPSGAETHRPQRGLCHFSRLQRIPRLVPLLVVKGRMRINQIVQTARRLSGAIGKHPVGIRESEMEFRKLQGQVPEHSGVLGALTGKQQGRPAGFFSVAVENPIGGLPESLAGSFAHEPQRPVALRRPIGLPVDNQNQAFGRGSIGSSQLRGAGAQGIPGFVGGHFLEPGLQCGAVCTAERQNLDIPRPVDDAFFRLVLFEQTVKVAPAEAQGADPGAARIISVRYPGAALRIDIERRIIAAELILGLIDLDRRRQGLMIERQRRLDHTRCAGRGLGMTDLRLDRTQGAPGLRGRAEHLAQCADLDRVTDPGAGPVPFDQLDSFRIHPGLAVGPAQGFALPGRIRFVDGGTTPVTGGADPLDHRVNPVPVPFRVGQPLDDHDAQAFAEGGSVGIPIIGPGVPRRRERGGLAKTGVHEDIVEGIDPPGHHHVAAPGGQLQGRQVEGAQRTAAGCIDHAVGSPEIEMLADTPGHHIAEQTRKGVLLPGHIGIGDALHHIFGHGILDPGIGQGFFPARIAESGPQRNDQFQGAGHAENDTDHLPVILPLGGVSGILERLLHGQQPEQLRRIDRFDGIGQYSVIHGIEFHRIEKAAHVRIDLVGRSRILIIVILGTPVSCGNLGNTVHPAPDIGPETVGSGGTGKHRADADDRQRDCGVRGVLSEIVACSGQLRYSLICTRGSGACKSSDTEKRHPCCCN